jgi:mannose-6-phosphate isomerase-like protein (cupin superfamily)
LRQALAGERGHQQLIREIFMRTLFLVVGLTITALPAMAQTPAGPVLYASPDDVAAAAARSKASASLSAQVVVSVPPLRVAAEYRSKPTPASVHEKNNELINVLNGSGTLIVGGTLKDEKRRDDTNLTGSGIDGGRSYELLKGSYLFIPAGTPHYFATIGKDGLLITTTYIPAAQ